MKSTKMKSYEILKIVESLKQSKFDFTKLNRDTFFHSIRRNMVNGKFATSCANISCGSCIFNSIGHETKSGCEWIGCTINEYLKLCRKLSLSNKINFNNESDSIEELIFNISQLLNINDLFLEYSGTYEKNEKH